MRPVEALERIAYLLERGREETYRVRAYRGAANAIRGFADDELRRLAGSGKLRDLPGVGEKTEQVIVEALAGDVPAYLRKLEGNLDQAEDERGKSIRAALKGDCHMHSDWSDGGSPIRDMALAARELGHEWVALTDHSPRLTVARGLTTERLRDQLQLVRELNQELAPFRILTGIEVDILDDGGLDQDPDLLAELDVVVASVHSKLRQDSEGMTARMLAAVANPLVNVLGHCTGRLVVGRGRPESTFDAEAVFSLCAEHDVAVEINSRPERLDPPKRLLSQALTLGCNFVIDTDAHAPGQLDWQSYGCDRAAACDVPLERIMNRLPEAEFLAWTGAGKRGQ
ncbi:MAG TPA: PHP domain-containing protein [Chloroflexota bacterium]|nr:PHP domain-containing protein [Chloroflexota bacterium]